MWFRFPLWPHGQIHGKEEKLDLSRRRYTCALQCCNIYKQVSINTSDYFLRILLLFALEFAFCLTLGNKLRLFVPRQLLCSSYPCSS